MNQRNDKFDAAITTDPRWFYRLVSGLTWPARATWNGLSPIGRVLFWLPFVLFFYALAIVVGPSVIFTDWLEQTQVVKWLQEKANRLFLAR